MEIDQDIRGLPLCTAQVGRLRSRKKNNESVHHKREQNIACSLAKMAGTLRARHSVQDACTIASDGDTTVVLRVIRAR
jgi:hypothetical protein